MNSGEGERSKGAQIERPKESGAGMMNGVAFLSCRLLRVWAPGNDVTHYAPKVCILSVTAGHTCIEGKLGLLKIIETDGRHDDAGD